ncbi:MAG: restriction endonuclease subunit S [Prolixibacteraceae bacterium]|nr:restriction endonuclease subunit S [Prolixibacteraceae bacterium]
MSEWKEYKLGEYVDLISGFAFKSENFVEIKANGCLPIIKIKNVANGDTNLDDVDYHQYDDSLYKFLLSKGDVLIAMTGNHPHAMTQVVGGVSKYRLEINALLNQRVGKFVAKNNTDINFIYYLLKDDGVRTYLANKSSGSASQANISKNDILGLKLHFPSLPTQHRIASILSAYDDLIENNNRRIALLEQMAEQIYKEWFVRMRFPGYENTEFEKGVPKGWEVKSIKDFGKVITGKTPSTSNSGYFGGKYPFIKTPDMHGNIFVLQTEETLTDDGFNSQKSQALPANSICVNCIGAGAGSVSITPSKCMTNQQIHTLKLENQKEIEFLFFVFRGLKPMIEMVGSTGATMINVSKGKFENLKLIKPSDNLIEDFSSKTKPIFLQIRNLMEQQITLKQTRDLLLPRLISGKLQMKESEIKLEKI